MKAPQSWLILFAGAVLNVLSLHGPWMVPYAAWVYGIFFLRFTRSHRWIVGAVGLWVAIAASWPIYLAEIGKPILGPMLPFALILGTTMILPYLADRLITPRIQSAFASALVFPSGVVAAEFGMATLSPLGNIVSMAATQHANLPLLQLASITGSYGISFLMAWVGSTCNAVWERRSWLDVRAIAITVSATMAIVLTAGCVRLAQSTSSGPTVRIAGVSSSRSAKAESDKIMDQFKSTRQAISQNPDEVRRAFDIVNEDLLTSTVREARAGAKIVVWSESAASVLNVDRNDLIARIGAVAASTGIYIAAGMAVSTDLSPYTRNEVVLLTPAGQAAWTVEKAHPVPGLDNLIPGDGRLPSLDTPFGRVASVICFDADFPGYMRTAKSVDIMMIPSSDWLEFGRVHTEKSTLRAVENGYSIVRQDNHGLARMIDPYGRSLATADFFAMDQQTMVGYVPQGGVQTIYSVIGDAFAWLCIAILIALGLMGGSGRRRPARSA